MFSGKRAKKFNYFEVIKRSIDLIGSVFFLILFTPLLVIAAFLIKMTSPGPVFADIPKRVGKNGKLFRLYKFRSMIVNAHRLMKTDPKFKHLYKLYKESSYKLYQDPRVTDIGKVIRRYSIDEMPQFINVIKGEMSIVGPRAYYQDELIEQQRNYSNTRSLVKEVLKVKPGITGYWQVSGRSEVNFDKRIEMDAYYARKRSVLFDVLIILKTPWAMISGKGAV